MTFPFLHLAALVPPDPRGWVCAGPWMARGEVPGDQRCRKASQAMWDKCLSAIAKADRVPVRFMRTADDEEGRFPIAVYADADGQLTAVDVRFSRPLFAGAASIVRLASEDILYAKPWCEGLPPSCGQALAALDGAGEITAVVLPSGPPPSSEAS